MKTQTIETNWKIETLGIFILEYYGWKCNEHGNDLGKPFVFERSGVILRMQDDILRNLVTNKQLVSFYA